VWMIFAASVTEVGGWGQSDVPGALAGVSDSAAGNAGEGASDR